MYLYLYFYLFYLQVPPSSSACFLERSLPYAPLLCERSKQPMPSNFFPQKWQNTPFPPLALCLKAKSTLKKQRNTLWSQFPKVRPQTAAVPPSQSGSEEDENRVFLLVVGLGSQVLGVLLETGGCAVVPQVALLCCHAVSESQLVMLPCCQW